MKQETKLWPFFNYCNFMFLSLFSERDDATETARVTPQRNGITNSKTELGGLARHERSRSLILLIISFCLLWTGRCVV
jgi:hypothetical protein